MRKIMINKILLQINFIILAIINLILKYCFILTIKQILLWIIGVKIGKATSIQAVKIFSLGKLVVGDNCCINSGVYLDNRRGIVIGNNVNISHDTKIYTLGHDIDSPTFDTKGKKVIIDNNVVIFSNVLIMPGVRINEGAVILPGSVVTKNVDEYTVVGGNPAVYKKNRSKNIDYKLDYRYWFAL
jgi:maltose O-acetyltransferase